MVVTPRPNTTVNVAETIADTRQAMLVDSGFLKGCGLLEPPEEERYAILVCCGFSSSTLQNLGKVASVEPVQEVPVKAYRIVTALTKELFDAGLLPGPEVFLQLVS